MSDEYGDDNGPNANANPCRSDVLQEARGGDSSSVVRSLRHPLDFVQAVFHAVVRTFGFADRAVLCYPHPVAPRLPPRWGSNHQYDCD